MEKTTKKTIALIGGSQGVGLECLKIILKSEQFNLKVLVRNPSKLKEFENDKNLEIVKGDILDSKKVEETIINSDAVINSLGSNLSENFDICSKGTSVLINEMKKCGVDRIITCSSLGVGDSYSKCGYFTRFIIWSFLSKAIADKDIQEDTIKKSGLKYIIVRPPQLVDWGYTGKYRVGYDVSGGKISRSDVADWIVKNVFSDEYVGKTPSIVSV